MRLVGRENRRREQTDKDGLHIEGCRKIWNSIRNKWKKKQRNKRRRIGCVTDNKKREFKKVESPRPKKNQKPAMKC